MIRRINRTIALRVVLSLAIIIGAASSLAQSGPPPETRRVETLAPGIEHLEIRRGDFASLAGSDRWVIHALIVDPRKARLELARAKDKIIGTETVSSIAARHGALAAVNGGFFQTAGAYRGEPIGLLARGNRILSEPSGRSSALAVSNADGRIRIAIARIAVKAEVMTNGGTARPVKGFNRPRGKDDLIVFTPEFNQTTLTSARGIEIAVERNRVSAIYEGKGDRPIPPEGFVISASGKARTWALEHLRAGAAVEVRSSIIADPPLPFFPEVIIGGGPRLVKAGKPRASGDTENFSDNIILKRHPRTAIGVRGDGTLVLATVDGRQPRSSVGMTIAETAALMIDLGCVEAVNLDGGGSATMIIRDKIVNSPSDLTGERPVGDAILVFPRTGEEARTGNPAANFSLKK